MSDDEMSISIKKPDKIYRCLKNKFVKQKKITDIYEKLGGRD